MSAAQAATNTPSGRFPRSSRLLKHGDFQTVYQKGKKGFSGNFIALYCDRAAAGGSGPRIGFTVGKALGGAVVRNRIRRRVRDAVRRHIGEVTRPVDIVLHPRKSVLDLDFVKLEAEIRQLFAMVEKGKR